MSSLLSRSLAERLLPAPLRERLAGLRIHDAGHGYDALGLDPDWLCWAVALSRPLYERYFRVTSYGLDHLPQEGAAILASNHSGLLPVDGAMIALDVIRGTDPVRVLRVVADFFVPLLPIVGTALSRMGTVPGARGNFRHLLEAGELVLVFPEGTAGVSKPFAERYHLQRWTVGHAELALCHRVPVIPVAVIGAEEAWPLLGKITRFRLFGAPYLPVPLTPLPLPVRYHIHYGAPLHLEGDPDDPVAVRAAADRVRDAVDRLIGKGLDARSGVLE